VGDLVDRLGDHDDGICGASGYAARAVLVEPLTTVAQMLSVVSCGRHR
jgi:hypothetical protein